MEKMVVCETGRWGPPAAIFGCVVGFCTEGGGDDSATGVGGSRITAGASFMGNCIDCHDEVRLVIKQRDDVP